MSNTQLSYSSSSLHNNSIITSYTGYVSYYSSYTRMSFYCCSNPGWRYTGTFIGLYGYSYSGIINVQRYRSSHSYAGCMYISLSKIYGFYSQNYLSSSEEGIYTCRMSDSTGRNIDVSVGIYRHGYACKFIVHI